MNYTLFSYVLFPQASDQFYRCFIKITISFPLDIIHYHTRIPTKVSEMNVSKVDIIDVINFYE